MGGFCYNRKIYQIEEGITMEKVFIDSEFQDLIDTLLEDRKCGNLDKLKEDATRLKENAIRSGNDYAEAVACYFLAGYCLMCNELAKSIAYCNYVKENYSKHQSHYVYAMCCSIAGTAHMYLNKQQTAVSYFLDGYYISLKFSFFDTQANILNNMGSIFYELGDYKRGIEYFLRAYDVTQNKQYKNPNPKTLEMILVNLSGSYARENKFEEAKYWEQKYLDIFGESNDLWITNNLLINHMLMDHASGCHSKLVEDINLFLESMKDGWADLFSIRIILEVIEICLELKEIELTKRGIELVESKMKNLNEAFHKERLASMKIQLYELTNEKDKLFEELLKYYTIVRQNENEKKEIESSGVLSRIHLRHAEYSKRQIEIKNKELKRLNERDSFTGLLNKAFFEKKVQERLQRKTDEEEKDVLLIIDIDNFKEINDTYGHVVGDQVIKEVANLLQNKTRHMDYVGRIGGDEFCVLMLDIPNMEVMELWIKNFIKSVQDITCDKVMPGEITVSVGAASSDGKSTNLELFEKADKAMYEAKKKAKNTYGTYGKKK